MSRYNRTNWLFEVYYEMSRVVIPQLAGLKLKNDLSQQLPLPW